jgi:hypothetical protein
MNADWSAEWSSYELPSLSQLPTSVVVGIIRVNSDRDAAGGDETLHGTLCRLAGVIPDELENLIPRRSRPLEATSEFAEQRQLSADVPQISADLAEEYHELVAALGS